jgi:hypothetical protein
MKQVAPLRYDMIFKKAFSDPEMFTTLVSDFLDIKLEIDFIETDKVFIPFVGSIATKFDLFAEDKKNRVIVEVQHVHYPDSKVLKKAKKLVLMKHSKNLRKSLEKLLEILKFLAF